MTVILLNIFTAQLLLATVLLYELSSYPLQFPDWSSVVDGDSSYYLFDVLNVPAVWLKYFATVFLFNLSNNNMRCVDCLHFIEEETDSEWFQ